MYRRLGRRRRFRLRENNLFEGGGSEMPLYHLYHETAAVRLACDRITCSRGAIRQRSKSFDFGDRFAESPKFSDFWRDSPKVK